MKKRLLNFGTLVLTSFIFAGVANAQEIDNGVLKSIKVNTEAIHDISVRNIADESQSRVINSIETRSTNENIYSTPFKEDFENTSPSLGDWTLISGGKGRDFSIGAMENVPAHSGSSYLLAGYDSNNPRNEWVFTPGISLTGGKAYTFEVWGRVPGYDGVKDEFKVSVGNLNSIAAQTTVIIDKSGSNSVIANTWTLFQGTYTPTTTGTYYFSINFCTSVADVNAIAFDDVSVKEVLDYNLSAKVAYIPEAQYTQTPAFLAVDMSGNAFLEIENIGTKQLTGVTTAVKMFKNSDITGTPTTTSSIVIDNLVSGKDSIAATADKFVVSKPSSVTKDTYQYTFDVTSNEGATESVTSDIVYGGIISNDVYARDNGETGGTLSVNGASTDINKNIGQVFTFYKPTILKSITFGLGTTGTATSARVRVFNSSLVQIAESDPVVLLPGLPMEYSGDLGTSETPLSLAAGTYVLAVEEIGGKALGVIRSTNNLETTYYSVTNPTTSGLAWYTYPATLNIRAVVADPSETSIGNNEADAGIAVYQSGNKIVIEGIAEDVVVALYNISGQQILSTTQKEILVSDIPAGVYVVKAGTYVTKVMVK